MVTTTQSFIIQPQRITDNTFPLGNAVTAAVLTASHYWLGEPRLSVAPTAYVCEDYACQFPVTEPEPLLRMLEAG